ncbi:dihydrodipicolinate synthase family protein [Bacteroidota bacterium]
MITGVFPPIPTPFFQDEVAYDKLKFNLNKMNETDFTGYVVLGSNGENVHLTKEEKIKIIESVRDVCPENKIVIAGTGSDCYKDTIELTNHAADFGINYALVITPYFYKSNMNDVSISEFYTRIADSARIPVILYNVPKFTNVNISPGLVFELSAHPNIVGIKNSTENIAGLSEMVNVTKDDFSVIVGTATVFYPGLCVGAVGGILALANIASSECLKVYNHMNSGNHEKALETHRKLLTVDRAIVKRHGLPGLKTAMDFLGYYGGPPRLPLREVSEKTKSDIKVFLEKAELL